MYTTPLGAICRNHGINYHFYADDSRLYLSFELLDKISQIWHYQASGACLNLYRFLDAP